MRAAVLTLIAASLWAQPPQSSVPTPAPATPAGLDRQFHSIRRVYVDVLDGGQAAMKIRDLLIASLQSSQLFIITEDEGRADAFLRGAAEDSSYISSFSSNERTNARGTLGLPLGGGGRYSNRISTSEGASDGESRHTDERVHEAMATLRLVTKEGDVIWSTTQESSGGKFRGAAADVADRVAKKLAADLNRAKEPAAPTENPSGAK